MKKLKSIFIVSTLTLILILVGCVPEDSIEDVVESGGAYEEDVASKKEDLSEKGSDESNNESSDKGDENLKIISSYKFEAETVDFKSDLDKLVRTSHNYGGYVRSKDTKDDKQSLSGQRTANIVLKIPKGNLRDAINDFREIVSIKSETISSSDITDDYYSIEDKVESITSREDRLMELYKESTDIEDIVKIDEKLFELEELKKEELRKKEKIDNKIVFSRVEIDLEEVKKLPEEKEEKSETNKVSNAFLVTGNNVKDFFVDTFVSIIIFSPFIVLISIGVFIYVRYIRKLLKEKE